MNAENLIQHLVAEGIVPLEYDHVMSVRRGADDVYLVECVHDRYRKLRFHATVTLDFGATAAPFPTEVIMPWCMSDFPVEVYP